MQEIKGSWENYVFMWTLSGITCDWPVTIGIFPDDRQAMSSEVAQNNAASLACF